VIVLFSFSDSIGGFKASQKQLITAPYQFNLMKWEIGHVFDNWVYHSKRTLAGHQSAAPQGIESVRKYFKAVSGEKLRQGLFTKSGSLSFDERKALVELITEERFIQSRLKAAVEATLEAAVGSAIDEVGIPGKFGPIRWPPVDFVFEPSPLLLVTSPKDRIQRGDDILLKHDVTLETKDMIEAQVEAVGNISALIVNLGGIATYPAHISNYDSLHAVLILVSHEWLHHYLFFRPLGFCCLQDSTMVSVNETIVNMASKEIGDLAFALLTGDAPEKPIYPKASLKTPSIGESRFDFRSEMRKTRIYLDGLLEVPDEDQVERYLEDRRKIFMDNGFNIRKLNTAYFAFYGTYGTNPASVSPIEGQVRAIRSAADDLPQFLNKVSRVTSYEDLEGLARESGWTP
jgi:hypothetical protein